jgi:hypothetical protein
VGVAVCACLKWMAGGAQQPACENEKEEEAEAVTTEEPEQKQHGRMRIRVCAGGWSILVASHT